MELKERDTILVTGASGFVGCHVVETALRTPAKVRAFVRPTSSTALLDEWGVDVIRGELNDSRSLAAAMQDVTVVVNCAAKVGDWGPVEEYRQINVEGLKRLIDVAQQAGSLRRFVQISSLGVYAARDHHGTDETTPPAASGIDGYTLSKIEGERVICEAIEKDRFPAVILRPGFIYGPRDRTIFPRLLANLKNGRFRFIGSGENVLNNTYVGNLALAVMNAIDRDSAIGEIYNIRDERLVTRKELISAIAKGAGYPTPTRSISLPLARGLAWMMEGTSRLLGRKEAPLVSQARIKFLALNLDFSIDKARKELNYQPACDFRDAIAITMQWFRDQKLVP